MRFGHYLLIFLARCFRLFGTHVSCVGMVFVCELALCLPWLGHYLFQLFGTIFRIVGTIFSWFGTIVFYGLAICFIMGWTLLFELSGTVFVTVFGTIFHVAALFLCTNCLCFLAQFFYILALVLGYLAIFS